MRSTLLLLASLLVSACAGSMVPPCELGETPELSLTSEDRWPEGSVSTDDDGQEQVDFVLELRVVSVTVTPQWIASLTDDDGALVVLTATSEAGTTMPVEDDVLDVRYHRWYVGEFLNEWDESIQISRVGGSMFAWAASATTVDDLDVPDGVWMESGQETCRDVQEDRTSWYSSLVFGGEYDSVVEVDPASSTRIGDWDLTNALNRRTHFKDADLDDTWAVAAVGFLFE